MPSAKRVRRFCCRCGVDGCALRRALTVYSCLVAICTHHAGSSSRPRLLEPAGSVVKARRIRPHLAKFSSFSKSHADASSAICCLCYGLVVGTLLDRQGSRSVSLSKHPPSCPVLSAGITRAPSINFCSQCESAMYCTLVVELNVQKRKTGHHRKLP